MSKWYVSCSRVSATAAPFKSSSDGNFKIPLFAIFVIFAVKSIQSRAKKYWKMRIDSIAQPIISTYHCQRHSSSHLQLFSNRLSTVWLVEKHLSGSINRPLYRSMLLYVPFGIRQFVCYTKRNELHAIIVAYNRWTTYSRKYSSFSSCTLMYDFKLDSSTASVTNNSSISASDVNTSPLHAFNARRSDRNPPKNIDLPISILFVDFAERKEWTKSFQTDQFRLKKFNSLFDGNNDAI